MRQQQQYDYDKEIGLQSAKEMSLDGSGEHHKISGNSTIPDERTVVVTSNFVDNDNVPQQPRESAEVEQVSHMVRFTDPDEVEQVDGFAMGEGGIDDLIDEDEYDNETESESEYLDDEERNRALQMLQQHNDNQNSNRQQA